MTDLRVRGACGSTRFLDFLEPNQLSWQDTIDLRRMTFCEPLGLVGIAAFAERSVRDGNRCVVTAPEDPSKARYLARMHLGTVLASLGAEHNLPRVQEHHVGDSLFELSPFDGARGAGALAAMLHDTVEPDDPGAAQALHECLCEAGQNVAHHAGVSRGFMAAQRTHRRSRFYFAVSDSGKGMLATLKSRGAATSVEAIRLALERGLTGTTDRGRGVGLPDVVDHLYDLSGSLHIVSGDAAVTARGRRRWLSTYSASFSGTLLQGYVQTEHGR